jgi:type IX secretion system PorP/SprF family membrane protein
MRGSIFFLLTVMSITLGLKLCAQDPHFSQFFMAPQFVNPSLTGSGSGDWRIMGNVRQQWGNAGTPFSTQAFAGDVKVMGKEDGENTLAISGFAMNDQSMNGAFKSIYAGGSIAYHLRMGNNSSLSAGFQANYGHRRLDYNKLNFGEQFTSGGFDVSLPTGETSLQSMKPFYSLGAGILYNYYNETMNIDAGIASFDINQPKQSFINDEKQFLKRRYVFHYNMEFNSYGDILWNVNTIFQLQSIQNYFSIGGGLGYDLTNGLRENIFFAGAWFREGDAIYPYAGMQIGSFQFGLSYDITISKQNNGPVNPRSFELSFVLRQAKKIPHKIPCPWN